MSVYKDMAHDAGYRGEEAEQMARAIEEDHMRQAIQTQEQEPDQIDMMDDAEVRRELRKALVEIEQLRNNYAWARSCLSAIVNHKDEKDFEIYARAFAAYCLKIRPETTKDTHHPLCQYVVTGQLEPCDCPLTEVCAHDWELVAEQERRAMHGPDEVGEPVYVSIWKCQKPECGVFRETDGNPPSQQSEKGND